jgi:dihydroflavonol-4-reductase
MARVLVTGGHGFIGARVVGGLVARGHHVRCLVRPTSNTRRLEDLPWERREGDVRDPASLAAALADCALCIHLASISSWDAIAAAGDELEQTVVGGTRNVLLAAVAAGVQRVVHVSSAAAVNGSTRPRLFDESSPFELEGTPLRYAVAKHRAEMVARQVVVGTGTELVTVNPVETYGPGDDALVTAGTLRDFLRTPVALGSDGGTGIAHVDDVAAGILLALEGGRPGERYILGGDNVTVEGLIRLTLAVAGVGRKPVVVVPTPILTGVMRTLVRLRLPTPVYPVVLDYATRYWFMDDRKARRELGYRSRSAREVLEPTIQWLYEAGHVPRRIVAG